MKHKVDWKRNFFAEPSVDTKVELQVTSNFFGVFVALSAEHQGNILLSRV